MSIPSYHEGVSKCSVRRLVVLAFPLEIYSVINTHSHRRCIYNLLSFIMLEKCFPQ